MPPTINWDETNPQGTQAISLGDDRIREMKAQIREIMEVDHVWSQSGSGSDWGRHKKVTLKTYEASSPAATADSGILFTKDVSNKAELHWIDEDGNLLQLTKAGNLADGIVKNASIADEAVTNSKISPTAAIAQSKISNAARAIDAALLGGYAAGNGSGNVPISNGTLNTNLNAALLGGVSLAGILGKFEIYQEINVTDNNPVIVTLSGNTTKNIVIFCSAYLSNVVIGGGGGETIYCDLRWLTAGGADDSYNYGNVIQQHLEQGGSGNFRAEGHYSNFRIRPGNHAGKKIELSGVLGTYNSGAKTERTLVVIAFLDV